MSYHTAFVWLNVSDITSSYHSGGGALVVAPDLETARTMLDAECPDHEANPRTWRTVLPFIALPLASATEPGVVLFPDAGCC